MNKEKILSNDDVKEMVIDWIYKESKVRMEERIREWFYDKNEIDEKLKRYES